ncbi:MAG: efflux RND transporter periplasmic adaptor subunit [Rhodospirillaceae bacterium]|jgi:multidrug efflux pump subunit AcrA (membrane-fusion protein)|nr:efflux RND transporter periplasmic adaptor subunit [Rhodospirillaceae bacterium]MBT4116582.1 efflux RND transporter periplasmic adaptor subunit [Rhodospirillaceae bacterium]MBT4671676.1 efflux RND transporter periplasmic adaptor subunit [Rhodospirillaceae bacterium]MBT5178437.1 efflux RND transporter periplasmic adaptor subunit [Rhodospirillaceae bacterium]MBT5840889.1 efflux RND transporter periplasmic adaptor subunit [Rhodospirillaceae bacterium]
MSETQSNPGKSIWKRLLIIVPILIGVAFVAYNVRNPAEPGRSGAGEVARKVRIITVPRTDVVPRALGFGTVTPGTVWEAVAEVQGKVIEIHSQLKSGAILPKGTILLRIDPADYRLALRSVEADVAVIGAQLAELAGRGANTRASLAIENRLLAIARRELDRKRQLVRSRVASAAAVDTEERNLLVRQQSIQTLANVLNLLPVEKQKLDAQLASARIRIANARRDLERTIITLPFDARIAKVNVEKAQFAKSGQTLLIADSINISEISAQLPIDKMFQLLDPARIAGVTAKQAMGEIENILGLTPIIRLKAGALVSTWQGRVARIADRIDPRTRTIGVIVAVDNPYAIAAGDARPPLAKNMYVEVELRGRVRAGETVIPRSALRDGKAFVVTADNRLQIRSVKLRLSLGGVAVIESGIKAGERIVISDLIPAIDGMLLDPAADAGARARLIAEAAGKAGF